MRIFMIVIRLLLFATALCSIAAAWPVGFSAAGTRLHADDINVWSGLLGMLIAGAAAIAFLGAIMPTWVLANPAGPVFALVPLVVLILVRFSRFDSPLMLTMALIGALCAALATLCLPPAGMLARRHERRASRRVRA